MLSTETSLKSSMFDKYGPLLSLVQLATMLDRTPDGLRMTLRDPSAYAKQLNAAKVRIGRRIYFRTVDVAQVFMAAG